MGDYRVCWTGHQERSSQESLRGQVGGIPKELLMSPTKRQSREKTQRSHKKAKCTRSVRDSAFLVISQPLILDSRGQRRKQEAQRWGKDKNNARGCQTGAAAPLISETPELRGERSLELIAMRTGLFNA